MAAATAEKAGTTPADIICPTGTVGPHILLPPELPRLRTVLVLHISRGVCLTEHVPPLRYLAAMVAHLVPVYHQLGVAERQDLKTEGLYVEACCLLRMME